jgi:hypothetical protein
MNRTIGNIINKELDKTILNNEIFKQISESDIEYLSKETQDSMIQYRNSSDGPQISKQLWKNLLIDSICILKVNDSREKIYNDSKSSNKFIENYSKIRKSSSFGIDEIDNYFNDFIEFERALYGSDEHYRDHVEHVLQVWALGLSLISHNTFL